MSFLLFVGFALYFLAFITAQGSFHYTASFAENKSLREGRGRKKPLEGGFLEKTPPRASDRSRAGTTRGCSSSWGRWVRWATPVPARLGARGCAVFRWSGAVSPSLLLFILCFYFSQLSFREIYRVPLCLARILHQSLDLPFFHLLSLSFVLKTFLWSFLKDRFAGCEFTQLFFYLKSVFVFLRFWKSPSRCGIIGWHFSLYLKWSLTRFVSEEVSAVIFIFVFRF